MSELQFPVTMNSTIDC